MRVDDDATLAVTKVGFNDKHEREGRREKGPRE